MKKLAIVLALLLALSGLTTVALAEGESPTLDKILADGKIVVGCSLSGMPIGGYDENGDPCGYDVDWANTGPATDIGSETTPSAVTVLATTAAVAPVP